MHRVELLNWLIEVRQLTSYLEIGCHRDETFRAIPLADKVGVDPQRGGTHRMTSDDWFARSDRTFDLIFIDGLHTFEQSRRDLCQALRRLTPLGCVVLHDCLPVTELQQRPVACGGAWTGEVWKTYLTARTWPHVDAVLHDDDWGLGVLQMRPNSDRLTTLPPLTWEGFLSARKGSSFRIVNDAVLTAFIS